MHIGFRESRVRLKHHPHVRLDSPLPENGQVSVVTARDAGSGMASGRSACATGKHFPKATLSLRDQRWTLTDVMVSSCASDGMTLSYRTAQVAAPPPEAAAGLRPGYDVIMQKKSWSARKDCMVHAARARCEKVGTGFSQ